MLRRLFQSSSLPIGLDIGASGARLLQLRRMRGGHAVVAGARVEYGEQVMSMPPLERLTTLTEALKAQLGGARFTTSRCVVSIDDALLRVRSVRQPQMPEEESDKALRLEGANRLGFPSDEPAEVGWLAAGEVRQAEDVRNELLVVGALREHVERIIDAVASAGLRPICVEPGFIACARGLSRKHRRAADMNCVRMAVDIGRSTTGVSVLRGASPVFFKLLEIGGARLDAAVAERLEMEIDDAARLRRSRMADELDGDAGKTDPRVHRAVFDAVRPILGELAREINLCLRYYTVTFRGARPETAMLTGGDAAEPGFADIVSDNIGLPAEIARPLDGVDLSDASSVLNRRLAHPQWCVAAGLSLRGDPQLASLRQEAMAKAAAEENDEKDKEAESRRAA